MKCLRWTLALIVGAALLAACSGQMDGVEGASEAPGITVLTDSIQWEGQGTDSEQCGKIAESPERTADGWIHWIVTSTKDVTDAELVLGGSGSGTYAPNKYGPVVEFFTPYFDVATLTATFHFDGTLRDQSQFVISDYCPGFDEGDEMLTVRKTVDTSFTRAHAWDVHKSVDPTSLTLFEDGTGDATATWDIDVEYLGFEDSDWNVAGTITIVNVGTLDAVITSVDDVLAGEAIEIDCAVDFPFALAVDEKLECTYDEDGYVEGENEVTVTTERDAFMTKSSVLWGDPTIEIDATVYVQDVSDFFGTVDHGTVTAPSDHTFQYSETFAWADYGAEECGEAFRYPNTVSLLDDADEVLASADATLVVNVSCEPPETDVLRVRKTADASYAREHQWDVTKDVDTSLVTLVADGSGDRTVTWTIDVDYLGATDATFEIFGVIEIENVSLRSPRTITSVMDDVGVAGVAPFAVACELDDAPVLLPFALEPGAMLECAYEVDVTAYVTADSTGTNTATVMATGEELPLTATAVWDFPEASSEKNATVYLWDYSDLNGTWLFLRQFDAPNGGTVTYQNHFAWTDYDGGAGTTAQTIAPLCCDSSYTYGNWAKLFASRQPVDYLDYLVVDSAYVTVEIVDGTCDVPSGEFQ